MKGLIKGVIAVTIGGAIYSVSQAEVAQNLSKDAGLSQQEAEQYIENIPEDELAGWEEIGNEHISEGQDMYEIADQLDCNEYEYEWETASLSCEEGKSQIKKFANDEIALGRAYKTLDDESASLENVPQVIRLIDVFNADFSLGVVIKFLDYETINELKTTNSYNKALLQTVMDSN